MTDEEKRTVKLFSITVTYNHDGETRLKKIVNKTHEELMRFREDVFVYGLALDLEPGHWLIIAPFDLGKIEIFAQRRWVE